MNELHEAFEKDPALRSASRERIEGALSIVLTRAQAAGVVRTDVDAPDLMQLLGSMCMSATLTPDQSGRLLVMIEDGLRPSSGVGEERSRADATPLRVQMPERSVRTGAGSGTWGMRALGGMVPSRPASKSSRAWPISALVFMTKGP